MGADSTLAQVTRDQWQWYLDQYAPLEESLIAGINSTELVDRARKDSVTQARVGAQSLNRDMARYGLNMTGAQRAQLQRQAALGNATTAAQTVNTARIDQRERNLGVAADLMMKGRGVSSQAISGLGDAASLEANRNAQNAQAKAQAKAQTMSTLGMAAGMALMFM